MGKSRIKILLVDDQETLLKGLKMRLALEDDLEVVGEARDGMAALRLVEDTQPDIVVMDIEMPKMDGLTATKALREQAPGVMVIILSLHNDPVRRLQAQQAGVQAFVEKRDAATGLIEEIRRAYRHRHTAAPG